MKGWVRFVLVTSIVAAGVGALWWKISDDANSLRLHGHRYSLTVLDDANEREKGLSGTESLATDRAVLFVFPHESKWGIWMKDMKYPIDIVWLDTEKRVIHLEKNVQPSSYPKVFEPTTPARYVIELAHGTIERTGITRGDPAGLPAGVQ